ncbi:hypothetical protein LA080_015289 [Diaporthe eres]|nr:hypothetical protein LA080_015289 [Diaporthe eres]
MERHCARSGGHTPQVPIDPFVSTGPSFTPHLQVTDRRRAVWFGLLPDYRDRVNWRKPKRMLQCRHQNPASDITAGPKPLGFTCPLSVLLTGLRGLSASSNTKNAQSSVSDVGDDNTPALRRTEQLSGITALVRA